MLQAETVWVVNQLCEDDFVALLQVAESEGSQDKM